MTESKHTPGPWEASESHNFSGTFVSYIYVAGTGTEVVPGLSKKECVAQTRSTTREVDEANAKIIAAAPKLFEACRTIIDTFEGKSGLVFVEHMALDSAVEAVEAVVGELHDHSKD